MVSWDSDNLLASGQPICVIMASRANAARAKHLDRAIESVVSQQGVAATAVVVVNGGAHDDGVIASLKNRPGVRLVELSYGGLPEARLAAREAVDTPFFGTLDDDDVLLPNALATRLEPMLAYARFDVVITNGYRETPAGRELSDPDIARFQAIPLEGLMERNWLNESAGLFRSASIGPEFFAGLPPVGEWTHMAFRLAQSRRILFLDNPTFVKFDSPDSLSHSPSYALKLPGVLEEMLTWEMSDYVRERLLDKYLSALHDTSVNMLQRGDYRTSWRFHLQSLRRPGGRRYLGYTRHILRRQLSSRFRARNGKARP